MAITVTTVLPVMGRDSAATADVEAAHPAVASDADALTVYERSGLAERTTLADGHAYHALGVEHLPGGAGQVAQIWDDCSRDSVLAAEARFLDAFATSAGVKLQPRWLTRIVPTASNAIDIIAAVARAHRWRVALVEPTFDNLALILRRRGVGLCPIPERQLVRSIEQGTLGQLVSEMDCDALFVVQPNNPTGHTLTQTDFEELAAGASRSGKHLLLDQSFRFFNRAPFDDYGLLASNGTSFLSFEDTGKVWPTHDLKASLMVASPDLAADVRAIYDELYLCHSRFALALLTAIFQQAHRVGLDKALWDLVDARRDALRATLDATGLGPAPESVESVLSVEWLTCEATGASDVQLVEALARHGVQLLPGRPFYWSGARPERTDRLRVSLLRPQVDFDAALECLASAARAGALA